MGREILIFYSMEKNDEYFQDSLTMYNLFKFKYSLMIQNRTLWAKELGGSFGAIARFANKLTAVCF